MTIKLGDTAKDTITGFKGAVIARHEYLNGCVRLSIQPDKVGKDGKPIEAHTFDIEQVELVKAAPVKKVKPTGGPHDEPARAAIPAR